MECHLYVINQSCYLHFHAFLAELISRTCKKLASWSRGAWSNSLNNNLWYSALPERLACLLHSLGTDICIFRNWRLYHIWNKCINLGRHVDCIHITFNVVSERFASSTCSLSCTWLHIICFPLVLPDIVLWGGTIF